MLQWKRLIMISLENIDKLITITDQQLQFVFIVIYSYVGHITSYHNNRLLTLTVITISKFLCHGCPQKIFRGGVNFFF